MIRYNSQLDPKLPEQVQVTCISLHTSRYLKSPINRSFLISSLILLAQLTVVLLPVTLLSVVVVVGVGIGIGVGVVDKLTCKLCSKYLYELSK